ncbi:AEC family transporter [Patulibacter sp. S7RM1-6]
MSGVLTGFAVIALVILVGVVAGRTSLGTPEAQRTLQLTAFFVASPALLFGVLAHADLAQAFSSFMAVAALSALTVAALHAGLGRFLGRRSVAETVVGALAAGYVNANNIGLPVAVYVLGDAEYVAPVLLLQLVVITPVTLSVLDVSTSGHLSARTALRPLANPLVVASLAGVLVALTGVALPDAVYAPFELLGGAAVPLMLLAFGMSLTGERPLRPGPARRPALLAAALKAVVMPLVAYVYATTLFALDGHALFAAVALAALPTAQNVFNYATRYGAGTTLARDVVLLSTLAAVPVLLVVTALLH